MGMAASQARFLNLTARKSNTEYQGQQVNQARTVLANESANIVAQMAALTVPTPPIERDYSKMVYTFADVNNNNATITDWQKNTDETSSYTHLVTISHKKQVKNFGTTNVNYDPNNYNLTAAKANDEGIDKVIDYYSKRDNKQYTADNFSIATSKDASKQNYFILSTDAARGGNVEMALFTTAYTDVESQIPANFNESGSGRFSKILLDPNNEVAKENGLTGEYNLGITRISDDEGYDSAWNQYIYDKDLYEQKVQELNAKTSQIQAEDKTLELQLKQLDTEQEALTQEMEAVKAVIQKNVEKTFNTFA